MKKLISLFLVLALLLGVLAVPAMAEETRTRTIGALSYLTMSEKEDDAIDFALRQPLRKILKLLGVLVREEKGGGPVKTVTQYYDTLNDLILALESGKLDDIVLPYYTARYLCATNDRMRMNMEYHPEKATGVAAWALSLLSDGYSFLLKEENTALRDEFDAQIIAMKEDGTLQKLIDEYIIKASEGGEPLAIEFEQFEGDPIKVGVTGDLPPMDYISADGSIAGFNTAVLAEIGKRLQKNIKLVQVYSAARSLALSQGKVDVVFWTRGMSENMTERRTAGVHLADIMAASADTLTEEVQAIFDQAAMPDQETIVKWIARDTPAESIITQPYFTDFTINVCLKDAP